MGALAKVVFPTTVQFAAACAVMMQAEPESTRRLTTARERAAAAAAAPDEVGSRAAARERRNGSTQACRERSDAKVCASASVAEGPSATLWTSFDVHLAISAPMGMGRRPKTFGIDFGLWTRRGHPQLSLEDL